ncbi:MAG TPA: hypothetical protein VMV89_08720, partial [Candidatus Paceibacterota bacterium]|nr:hypothetical protein [Candidatus Paceibacterota bacterium]
ATRRNRRSVFIRVAKLMVDDGEPVFHHWFAVNSPAAVNQQQVMKMARLETYFRQIDIIKPRPGA